MPVQYTLFGRPIPLRVPPRRFILLFSVIALFLFSLLLFGPPASVEVPTAAAVKEHITHPKLPKVPGKYNPFGPSAHKPPVQTNSTSGESRWLADWKWRNPFSSSVTLDENRAVLPPLKKRYPVYTFYDDGAKKDKEVKKAENELLLIWRRAWWAQGFKPIVLSRAEAMHNPLYESFQRLKLKPELETDLARWLAWGNMGTGILANWLALPMAPYQDGLLSHLRRGEYAPGLTRFEPLQNGLFYGDKESVTAALKAVSQKPEKELKEALTVKDLIDDKTFTIDKKADAIAYYDKKTLSAKYTPVAEKLDSGKQADGLQSLGVLINAHLHTIWQNTFSDGVVVLKPLPQHTTALVDPAVDIARNLTQCPTSPLPKTCPPNRPKCQPCNSAKPGSLQYLAHYRNASTIHTIGSVPHPYTFTSLRFRKETITARFLRREAERDMWLETVTMNLLAEGVSGASRVVRFKESVAGIHGASHSLWLTVERESHEDLEWIFGFRLPRESQDDSTSEEAKKAELAPQARPPAPKSDEKLPSEIELREENVLLMRARQAIKSKVREMVKIKEMVEMWNLADTEAWKFARAFSARRRVEREEWEQAERKFAGAESRTNGWNRWFDHAP